MERELTEVDDPAEEADTDEDDQGETMAKVFPSFFVMHSFKVKHLERKRRSTGSYRIYPRRKYNSTFNIEYLLL